MGMKPEERVGFLEEFARSAYSTVLTIFTDMESGKPWEEVARKHSEDPSCLTEMLMALGIDPPTEGDDELLVPFEPCCEFGDLSAPQREPEVSPLKS